jgi:D-serine deaminase-like pyridoxal phosphate-dependent protein
VSQYFCRAFGIPRVFLANELVDRAGIGWILDELARDPGFTFLCYVDSTAGVDLLAEGSAARGASAPGGLGLLVEMGTVGGRTGCRTVEEAVAVAAAAVDAGLPVVGVAGYEGASATRSNHRSSRPFAGSSSRCARLPPTCSSGASFAIRRRRS